MFSINVSFVNIINYLNKKYFSWKFVDAVKRKAGEFGEYPGHSQKFNMINTLIIN